MQHQANTGTAPAMPQATFGPFVPTCQAHGIGRTKAFELAASGVLETFTIGARRFVVLESLRTLPERMRGGAA